MSQSQVFAAANHSLDYFYAVSRGAIPGAEPVIQYGERTTAGADAGVLWPNGAYVIPAAVGVQLSLVSTSLQDAAAGTGARTVDLHGLDANLNPVLETVTLNGQTPVLTNRTDWRFVSLFHIVTYGSGKSAAGTITASNGATIHAEMTVGHMRGASSVYMVPKGKRLMVLGIFAGSSSGSAATSTRVEMATPHFQGHDYSADSIFVPVGSATYQDQSGGMPFPIPAAFTEGQVFGLTYTTDKAAIVTGTWFGVLEDA